MQCSGGMRLSSRCHGQTHTAAAVRDSRSRWRPRKAPGLTRLECGGGGHLGRGRQHWRRKRAEVCSKTEHIGLPAVVMTPFGQLDSWTGHCLINSAANAIKILGRAQLDRTRLANYRKPSGTHRRRALLHQLLCHVDER